MSAESEPSNGGTTANEADAEWRFQQLIFEIGKTRSSVLRIGLHTSEEMMEQILAAATDDAKNYGALVAAGIDGLNGGARRAGRCGP